MRLIVFIQLLNPFNGRKTISRDTGAERYFFLEIRRVRGLTLSCGNGKSEGVGGVTIEIPSVVGVWIFSGNTQFVINIV